jgi:hypothetical protein
LAHSCIVLAPKVTVEAVFSSVCVFFFSVYVFFFTCSHFSAPLAVLCSNRKGKRKWLAVNPACFGTVRPMGDYGHPQTAAAGLC